MKRIFIVIFFVAAFIAGAKGVSFARITIDAQVDKHELSLDDVAYLTVSVNDTRTTDTLPEVSDGGFFRVIYRGSSSRVSIVNGIVSSSVEFNYVLMPKKEGAFELPPVRFEHQGEVYKSDPIRLVITKPVVRENAKDIFAESEVSNLTPYVNEQIIFTFRFYTKVQIANATYDNPVFNDFITEALGGMTNYQKTINGEQYTVNEVKFALFPLKTGEHVIAPINAKADIVVRKSRSGDIFGGYFNELTTTYIATEEIKLDVRPLHEPGSDVPFSNLIGDFSIDFSLGQRSLNVGDSTTLTVTVHGIGNIKDMAFPEPAGLADFKTYSDKPVEDIRVTKGGIYGSKTFKIAFIPLKEGKLILPPVKFSFFSTKRDDYVTLSTTEYELDVKPSLEQEKLNLVEMVGRTTTKETVKIIGRDVLPINTSIDSLKHMELGLVSFQNFMVAFTPGFVYFLFSLFVKRMEKHSTDESILRKKRAFSRFKQAKRDFDKLAKNNSKEFYGALLGSFKKYVGDKFNVSGSAMTQKELNSFFTAKNLPRDSVDNVTAVMEKLERAQFASHDFSMTEKKEMIKILMNTAKIMERKIY